METQQQTFGRRAHENVAFAPVALARNGGGHSKFCYLSAPRIALLKITSPTSDEGHWPPGAGGGGINSAGGIIRTTGEMRVARMRAREERSAICML